MKKRLAFIGAGSHFDAVVAQIDREKYEIVGFFDDKKVEYYREYKVLGTVADILSMIPEQHIECLFISIGDNHKRKAIYEMVSEKYPDIFINIISKEAIILRDVEIAGKNIFIGSRTFLGSKVRIDNNCVINTGVIIEHHSRIKSHCNISPAATLNGLVTLEECVYIGSGAIVIQMLTICENTLVGAGAVVVKDILETGTYVGVPAKMLKKEVKEQ